MLSRLLLVACDMRTSEVTSHLTHSRNFISMSLCSIAHMAQLAPHIKTPPVSPCLVPILMGSLIHPGVYL